MVDEQLAPPFPAPIRFEDVEPRELAAEVQTERQTLPPDLWDEYLRRILMPAASEEDAG